MQIVLRVKDDGTAVIEKFGKTAEREGEKTSESWNKIGKSVGLVAAAAAATAAVMVKSAIDTADATGKAADKLGMTTEAFSALAYAAKTSGNITRDNFGQAMRMMVDNLSQAVQGTGLAKNAIADLGLNASALAKMGPEKAILAISDAMEKIPNQGDRVRIAMDVFRNSDMLHVLRGGSAGIREMMEEAKRMNQVIGDDTARQAGAFNKNIDMLKDSATGLANTVASSLLPALNALLERLNKAVGATNTLSVDLLQKDKEFLSVEFNAINKAAEQGFIVNTARAEVLRKQIEEIDAQIAEANKKAETNGSAAGTAGGGSSAPIQSAREATAKLKEELAKQLVVIHEATISEEQLLAEKYVRDYQALEKSLALKLMSQERYDEQRQALADTYEQQSTERQYRELSENIAQMAANIAAMEESFMTEAELEQARYEQKLLDLENYRMSELYIEETYNQNKENLEKAHQEKLRNLKDAALKKEFGAEHAWMEQTANLMKGNWNFKLQGIALVLGKAAQLMQSDRKKEFEFGKKAAIGEALISTFLGAAKALGTYGFPVGAAFAALTIAVGMMNVRRIQSQQFGGGGGAVPTFSASPNTGLPTATPGGDVGLPSSTLPPSPLSASAVTTRATYVNLIGDTFDLEWMRTKFSPLLEQAQRDGGIVIIR